MFIITWTRWWGFYSGQLILVSNIFRDGIQLNKLRWRWILKIYNYTVVFEPVTGGGYNVIVPAIPEICTCGGTLQEAKEMAEDAIRCYIESALKAHEPIPEDREPSIEKIAVQL